MVAGEFAESMTCCAGVLNVIKWEARCENERNALYRSGHAKIRRQSSDGLGTQMVVLQVCTRRISGSFILQFHVVEYLGDIDTVGQALNVASVEYETRA
jgi:hypothetical protein